MDNKRYDLRLGDFGPYNKEYMGVCHVADKRRGTTFNVELFPGFFRRSVLAHSSKIYTGLKLWGANADLTRFCYRYELEWKDRIYCDVDFTITNDTQVEIVCTFVNNSEHNHSLDMTLCASMQLPTRKPGSEVMRYRVLKGNTERDMKPQSFTEVSCNPDGEGLAFSQNMMRYNTLLNVVYPIYTRRQYIKHNTQGRFWDSLYSWDSGFIGMGLANIDFKRGFPVPLPFFRRLLYTRNTHSRLCIHNKGV